MKMVKLDEKIGDKKLSFWEKTARIRIFEKKIHHPAIFRQKKKHCCQVAARSSLPCALHAAVGPFKLYNSRIKEQLGFS
jgi:hypothetical protein